MKSPSSYKQPILGFRGWRLEHIPGLISISTESGTKDIAPARYNTLGALAHRHTWEPGPNKAVCLKSRNHDSPDKNCDCGIYAWHDYHEDNLDEHWMTGIVAGAGRTEVHSDGWRSEEAMIVGLLRPSSIDPVMNSRYEIIAERYGVPLFETEGDLLEYAESIPAVPARSKPLFAGWKLEISLLISFLVLLILSFVLSGETDTFIAAVLVGVSVFFFAQISYRFVNWLARLFE